MLDIGWGSALFGLIFVGFLSIMSLVDFIRTLKVAFSFAFAN